MKPHNSLLLYTALVSIVFFVMGELLFFRLFALFEPAIDAIDFQIAERPGKLPTSMLFSALMAVLPVLIVVIWRFAPVISTARRVGVVLVSTVCMIAGIFFRHQEVKIYFITVVRPFLLARNKLPAKYPIDPANFVYYMFAGFCIGCIFSFFLFRQKKYSNQAGSYHSA